MAKQIIPTDTPNKVSLPVALEMTNDNFTELYEGKLDKGGYTGGTAQDLKNSIDGAVSGYKGTIYIAETKTVDGQYTPMEAGTYPNAGGLVYAPETTDEGYKVEFIKTGATWVKNIVFVGVSAGIETWTAKVYNSKSQVFYKGKIYESNASTLDSDIPSSSNKWVEKIGDKRYVNSEVNLIFEQGGTNTSGGEYSETKEIRSQLLEFNIGDVLNLSIGSGYRYFVKKSATPPPTGVSTNHDSFTENPQTIIITSANKFMRIIVRNNPKTDLTPADPHNFKIEKESKSLFIDENEFSEYKETASNRVDILKTSTPFQSTFRDSIGRTGGVISIIDDDVFADTYSVLYPFLKNQGIPYGISVITGAIGNVNKITESQLIEMSNDIDFVEIMNHTHNHLNLSGLNESQINAQLTLSHNYLAKRGCDVNGLVLPFGGYSTLVSKVISKFYEATYGFGVFNDVTMETIKNRQIYRSNFGNSITRVQDAKNRIDYAIANNGWIILTTHISLSGYWDATSLDDLQTVIDYANAQGIKFMKPKEAFQIFGNFMENNENFAIQANGVIRTI